MKWVRAYANGSTFAHLHLTKKKQKKKERHIYDTQIRNRCESFDERAIEKGDFCLHSYTACINDEHKLAKRHLLLFVFLLLLGNHWLERSYMAIESSSKKGWERKTEIEITIGKVSINTIINRNSFKFTIGAKKDIRPCVCGNSFSMYF